MEQWALNKKLIRVDTAGLLRSFVDENWQAFVSHCDDCGAPPDAAEDIIEELEELACGK